MQSIKLIPVLALFTLVWLVGPNPAAAEEPEKKAELPGYTAKAKTVVERYVEALRRVKSYSGETVMKVQGGMGVQEEQRREFSYLAPNKFRIVTSNHEIVSDGKQVTIYAKAMRRYVVQPLQKDPVKQIRRYLDTNGVVVDVAEMMISRDPLAILGEQVEDLDLTGTESVDGDRCLVLEGKAAIGGFFANLDVEVPATLYLGERDNMLRRVEIDLGDAMKAQFEDNEAMQAAMGEYRVVMTVEKLKINEAPAPGAFDFKAPSGARKVEKFYTSGWMGGDRDTASQFEHSGKPAADFEIETHAGDWLTLDDLRGRPAILMFVSRPGMGQPLPNLDGLAKLQKEQSGKVSIVCVAPGPDTDTVAEAIGEAADYLTVAVDPGNALQAKYFESQWETGAILINAEGVVQGRYGGWLVEGTIKAMRNDLEALASGKKLAGAEPMTEEQIEEASLQRASRFYGNRSEPLNEDHLRQVWSVRARGSNNMIQGGSGSKASTEGIWVRDRDRVLQVDMRGNVQGELRLPNPTYGRMTQDEFLVGRVGRGMGVVYMTTIQDDSEEETNNQFGWRPPKGVLITAADADGEEVWSLELEVQNGQIPRHLALANLDGRGGDELIFTHNGALWVLDSQGETVVRKPMPGWAAWIMVDDLDEDRKTEIYYRNAERLYRFDYQPK
jgi:outer membrane lipoprotein-sorting protein